MRTFPLLLTKALEDIEITIKAEISKTLVGIVATLCVYNLSPKSRLSNQSMTVLKSEPAPFKLGSCYGATYIFTSQISPNSTDRDFLETHDTHMSFSKNGEIYLEQNESNTEPIGKIIILKELPQKENE